MLSTDSWPIAANMLPFGQISPEGEHIMYAHSQVWASQLRQVKKLGFNYIDPTDAWVPLAKLSNNRVNEFIQVLKDESLLVPSISMTRSSIVDPHNGNQNFQEAHRLLDLAPEIGATVVNIGFMQPLKPAQKSAVWFWLEKGHIDDPALRDQAITRVQELGKHAERNKVLLSIEMYEDTFVGTPEEAVRFIQDVDLLDTVGLNPDIGNLIRLHRPMPDYRKMFKKVLPYSNFWHIKNYSRDFDPKTGMYTTFPLPLKYGYINYRQIIKDAIDVGYKGPFCCEHYGSDSLGVIAENKDYIENILESYINN